MYLGSVGTQRQNPTQWNLHLSPGTGVRLSLSLIMATTTPIISYTSSTPTRPSIWQKFKYAVKEILTGVLTSTPVAILCCCYNTEELQMRKMDNTIREKIRESMLAHYYEAANDCVEQSVKDAALAGYDMTNAQGRSTLAISSAVLTPITNVSVVPKFAASCALLLRSRLGRLPPNEPNYLLVQREYLKICRTRGVRAVDVVAHQQFVTNAFFTEDVLDRIALTRSRWPSWMRSVYERSTFNAGPMAC